MSELRYAWRTLRKSPGFASVAILSLSLGIGANTAIYSVVRAVLEDPLPIPDPDRLMAVTQQWVRPQGMPGIGQINGTSYRDRDTGRSYSANFTYPLYRALRETAADSADLFVYTFLREVNVSVDNQS